MQQCIAVVVDGQRCLLLALLDAVVCVRNTICMYIVYQVRHLMYLAILKVELQLRITPTIQGEIK